MNAKRKAAIFESEYKLNLFHIKNTAKLWNSSPEKAALLKSGSCYSDNYFSHNAAFQYVCDEKSFYTGQVFVNDKQMRSHINSYAGKFFGLNQWVTNGKVIYDFSEELALQLRDDARDFDIEKPINNAIFERLPSQGLFISTPSVRLSGQFYMDGFFVSKDAVSRHRDGKITMHDSLQCTAVMFDDNFIFQCFSMAIPMHCRTVQDALDEIRKVTEETRGNIDEERTRRTRRVACIFLQFVLYLCSENAEIRQHSVDMFDAPRLSLISKSHVEADADIKDVGVEEGARIRKYKTYLRDANSYASVLGTKVMPPHIRRSHWHSYWVGKMDSPERRLILKWLSPAFIHKEQMEDARAVIAPIDKEVNPDD